MNTRLVKPPIRGERVRLLLPKLAAILAAFLLLSACTTMPHTSAIDSLGPEEVPPSTVSTLLKSGYDKPERNTWIEFNLIRIDEQYALREAQLRSLRTKWNVGTSTAALLFNVASSLTDSAGVKANYVAANTLAVGSNQIISKEEFLEQTVNTLVTAMQGRRAEMRKRVRIGMTRSVDEYTVADAYTDLQSYDSAGTLTEGMNFATDATKKESQEQVDQADAELKQALVYSEAEIQLTACVTKSVQNPNIDHDALAKVLDALEVGYPDKSDAATLAALLNKRRLGSEAAFQRQVHQLMLDHNLMLPCGSYQ